MIVNLTLLLFEKLLTIKRQAVYISRHIQEVPLIKEQFTNKMILTKLVADLLQLFNRLFIINEWGNHIQQPRLSNHVL